MSFEGEIMNLMFLDIVKVFVVCVVSLCKIECCLNIETYFSKPKAQTLSDLVLIFKNSIIK